MRFKQLVLLVLILCLALGMAFAQSRADQDAPQKGQRLPAPFARYNPQRNGTLVSSTMIYAEDFDPNPGSWMVGNGWFIGQDPLNGAVSAPNSAFTLNPYQDFANYELISPQIPLPAITELGTRYELKLSHWWDVESTYDYVYIDVMIGGQLETTLLTQTGYQAWTENALDLTAFAGETIQLRFRLVADGSGNYAGFGIDDIEIWKNVFEYVPEMNLLSLNAQNFPFIYSTLSVAMEGEDMSELDETNFQVYENDVLQTNFFSVTPPSTGAGSRLVDIAFQMDNSGSMSSSINAVSQNVTAFINNLAGSGVDSALGLCRYGQSANGGNPILEDSGILTTNLDYFRDNVWARNRIDGGYEPGYYAITQSLSGFNWRPGSQKVLIIITDETPNQGGASLQQAIDACVANGAILFALTYSSLYSTFTPITEVTGGGVYDINSNFNAILDHISQIIVSNYIISYRSSNPYYDGTLRNLRYVMNYQNVSAEEVGSYFPGQSPQIMRSPATMVYDNQAQLDNLDLPIEVIITDTYAPFTSNATLYYRNFDQSVYTPVAMQNTSGDLWSATIPAIDVQTPGIAYYFSASDGQSTSTLPSSEPANNPFTVAVLPNLPPVVTHFPQLQTNYYSPLNISATIFDDTDYVDDVILAYRRYGQLSYTQTPMNDMGDGVYNAQIPGEIVGTTGVEYYLRAWDNFGLVGASGYADNPHYVAAMLDGTVIPGGQITDMWWTPQNSPYYISSDVFVSPGSTLHVAAGSSVIFSPGCGLEIQGGFVATGAQFLAQNSYMGWDGIMINNAMGPIAIQNCSIQHAVVGVTFLNASGQMHNNTISKDAENNSFTGEAGVKLQGNSSPGINGLNVHNYTPAVMVQNINTMASNPVITNVYFHSQYDPQRVDGTALIVEGNVSLTLQEADIAEYENGIVWNAALANENRNTAVLTNVSVHISGTANRSVNQAINISNVSSLQGTGISILGYPKGLELANPELTNTGTATISGLSIRKTEDNQRTEEFGLKIGEKVALSLSDAEIEGYIIGIDIDAAESQVQNNAQFNNVRVLYAGALDRQDAYGIKVKNISQIGADDTEIDGFAYGMWIDNQALATTANALLTNIRVRNSASASRTEDYGIKIMSNMNLDISNVEIDDYSTGLALISDSDPGAITRNSALLTNIRVRNSSSSSRSAAHGIKLDNPGNVTANDFEIEGYPFGLHIDNQNLAGTANALLTNIRVRNSASASRTDDFGIKIEGDMALEFENIELDDFGTGLALVGNTTDMTRASALLTNIRVRNSSSSSRSAGHGIKVNNLQSVTADDAVIEGYPFGLELNHQNPAATGNVTLSNINVRNAASTPRTDEFGIKIGPNLSLELDGGMIDGFGTALEVTGNPDAPARSSVLISNIRIRNSASSSRNAGQGIKISNIAQIQANNNFLDDFSYGIDIDNQNLAGTSNALLTNIRVRNSASASRTDDAAIRMLGAITADVSDTEIMDYTTGLYFEGNSQAPSRTSALLTNIRVRNSSSSSRTEAKGIVLKNLSSASIDKCIVYPQLSSERTENANGAGIIADAVANLDVLQSNIWGYENGLRLLNGSHADFTRSVIWKNSSLELVEPILLDNSSINASFSNISAPGGVYPGTGNLDIEPKFADPKGGNFYLKPRSKLHNDDPALVIGALPYDFYALADTHSKTYQPGWNMLGVPYLLQPGQNQPVTVFGTQLHPFYVHPTYTSILQLNPNAMPDSLGHVVFSLAPSYTVPSHIRAGVGYWVRNPNPTPVNVTVYGLMDDDEYLMETPGLPSPTNGFFMLANPYDKPIKLNDGIRLEGTVSPWVRVYDHTSNSLPPQNLNTGAEIPAWASFIIKTSSATDKILFDYPSSRAQSNDQPLLANSGLSQSVPANPDWEMYLSADSGEQSSSIVLGVAEDALDGYDPMDVPAVPFRPYQAMELKINNQDWEDWGGNYSRDIRSNTHSSYTWHLSLDVQDILSEGRFDGEIRLSMNSPYKLPSEYSYRLVDTRSGIGVDLLTEVLTLPLSIDLNDPAQGNSPYLIPLMVIVEDPSVTANPELSEIATANYPNPFNPSTTITYSIPSDGLVSIDIYNIKGQLVRQLLSGEQSKGSHSVVWNGKDNNGRECSSGFYFYRVSAGNQSLTRKILMLK